MNDDEVADYISYTSQEAAAILRRSTGTLANWRVSGKGPPFIRIGGPIMYPCKALHAWLATNVRSSTTEKPGSEHHARPREAVTD